MKRVKFLQTILASSAFIALAPTVRANFKSGAGTDKGFFLQSGKDRHDKQLSLFDGDTFYTKVSGDDTDKGLYIFESTREKEGGPSLHIHYELDEWWYVLEGEFLIKVGDEVYQAKKGDSVFGPKMVPHCFAKVGNETGKLIIAFRPAGKMEEYFHKISNGIANGMTEEQRDQLRKEHGFERVGPPLTYLKQ